MGMINISPDEMRKKLASGRPYRETISGRLPSNTAVAVPYKYLPLAIDYYNQCSEKAPHFLIRGGLPSKQSQGMPAITFRDLSPDIIHEYDNICIFGDSFVRPDSTLIFAENGIENLYLSKPFVDFLSGWWTRKAYPDHIERRMGEIARIYSLISDEPSRNLFLGVIRSVQTGDPGFIPISPFPHYFHPKVNFVPGDVVIEGGVARADNTSEISSCVGPDGKVIGFEPLPEFYHMALEASKGMGNVVIEPFGLWSSERDFYIDDNKQSSRLVESHERGSEPCHVIDIDSYLDDRGLRCDAIKLDIEGAEMECLKGAHKTIGKYHPKLMISIYHHAYDYMDIPLWIADNFPWYEFYLGHHSLWYHETCLYAIHPEGRRG